MRKPELLVPAGSLENLKVAVDYGADAVYIGGEQFGLRAKAKNFTMDEMRLGIEYAHQHNVLVYVTANILAHNQDIEMAKHYFTELRDIHPDALIIADPGMLMIAKEIMPDMEFHLSTQANNTNYASFNFWYQQGVKRVVVARELSFEEIGQIRMHIPDEMDIEAFVHGAMCISYSGRCLLSNYMTGRDANKGACTHPCRWTYHLVEETRPGEYMPIVENERGTYIYNSKDLCMIDFIEELVKSGIYSFKIEGRMKTPLYVAVVTRTYRKAIDDYFENPGTYEANKAWYQDEIRKCSHRHFTTGFYEGKPNGNEQIYDSNTYMRPYKFVAKVLGYDAERAEVIIEQRNKFLLHDEVEVMMPDGENFVFEVTSIIDDKGDEQDCAPHPKQILRLPCERSLEAGLIIRKIDEDQL